MKALKYIFSILAIFAGAFSLEFIVGFFRDLNYEVIFLLLGDMKVASSNLSDAFWVTILVALLFAFILTLPCADYLLQRYKISQKGVNPALASIRQSFITWLIFTIGVLIAYGLGYFMFHVVTSPATNTDMVLDIQKATLTIIKAQWIIGLVFLILWIAFLYTRKYRNA